MTKLRNVLSLFDGMSCGQIALNRAGILYSKYYASEIDKYAIKVTQHNYPDTIQLGDINNWREWPINLSHVDLILAGSPCQGFSLAGKQLAFDDPRSKLFFVFVDILNHVKSLNSEVRFLLENVNMKKEYQDIISEHLGIEPIHINSKVFSAQDRKRSYWTNIKFSALPIENKSTVEDILESEVDIKYCVAPKRSVVILDNEVKKRKIGYIGSDLQGNRIYSIHGKSVCLRGEAGGLGAKTGMYGLPCLTPDQTEPRQNGRRFKPPHSKFYTLTTMDKYGVLTSHFIRKLTPLECERLQNVLQYIKQLEIVLCSDQAKNFVDAVEKNPKLLKLVSSAESEELREYVRRANQSTSASLASTKHTALQNADMQIQTQTEKCTNINRDGLNLIASSVENTTTYEQVENVESSVTQTVFINITEGRITHHGKEESRLTEQNYTELMNGKIALNLCGGEAMENAKYALSALEMMQTNQHSTSITSFRLSTKNIEQILTISYWFAKSAIDGFIQDTTSKKSLYLNLIDGYTAHVSNTQRYRMLGNGWTVNVIAHILKGIKEA